MVGLLFNYDLGRICNKEMIMAYSNREKPQISKSR
jgi:hypothetical protein